MEPEYEARADDVSANAAEHQPSHRTHQGCNRRHNSLLRFGRPALGDERPELITVQEVFSHAYKMLMKHKGLEKQLLDIPFNLCLLLKDKRPAFLIQVGTFLREIKLTMLSRLGWKTQTAYMLPRLG